ncbi:uncharacterized protein LOC142061260 [Phalacrocorax aristotelis]|uniref:uncharacterized protein LOC142061260 n=1 Tax=Phalacrocorax aristotelis TaxID=126867 RepID=UPI003F4C0E7C
MVPAWAGSGGVECRTGSGRRPGPQPPRRPAEARAHGEVRGAEERHRAAPPLIAPPASGNGPGPGPGIGIGLGLSAAAGGPPPRPAGACPRASLVPSLPSGHAGPRALRAAEGAVVGVLHVGALPGKLRPGGAAAPLRPERGQPAGPGPPASGSGPFRLRLPSPRLRLPDSARSPGSLSLQPPLWAPHESPQVSSSLLSRGTPRNSLPLTHIIDQACQKAESYKDAGVPPGSKHACFVHLEEEVQKASLIQRQEEADEENAVISLHVWTNSGLKVMLCLFPVEVTRTSVYVPHQSSF